MYVPWKLHWKLVKLRNHPNADDELHSFYARVSEEWTTGARAEDSPHADMYTFWTQRFNEQWPPTKPAAPIAPDPAGLAAKERYGRMEFGQ